MKRLLLYSFIVVFLITGCAKKKASTPIEPTEPGPEITVEEPSTPEASPAEPETPTPPPPRKPSTTLDAPPVKPRAASPGDSASIKLVERGTKLMNAGNLDEAEQMFEQALRVSPTNGRPYYYLGVIATKQNSYDRALGFLAQAGTYLQSDSFWMSQVYLQEGLVFKAQNNISAARSKFQEALRKDPNNSYAAKELKLLK